MRPGRIRPGNTFRRWIKWHRRAIPCCFNEARADSPGKCRLGTSLAASAAFASMRPGRIRPGNGHGGCPAGFRFNEARADSPGKCGRHGLVRPLTRPCFNEARADSPGKMVQDGRRFNEARARPGNDLPFRSSSASMRPGRIRPGNHAGMSEDGSPAGPDGFNEARADSPGKCPRWNPRPPRTSRRFNEARADSPGKYGSRGGSGKYVREPRHVPDRFNEARADSPGKYTLSEVLALTHFARRSASGRTRRCRQGELWVPIPRLSSSQLVVRPPLRRSASAGGGFPAYRSPRGRFGRRPSHDCSLTLR